MVWAGITIATLSLKCVLSSLLVSIPNSASTAWASSLLNEASRSEDCLVLLSIKSIFLTKQLIRGDSLTPYEQFIA